LAETAKNVLTKEKKMKKIKETIIIVLITFLNIMSQQEPRPETKAYILDKLQNGDHYQRSAVIGDATYMYIIPEVVPILEQTFWEQDSRLAFDYLIALDKYDSPNFSSLAHQFINTVDTMYTTEYSFSLFSKLEQKVIITSSLMKRGDFSTNEYVFELIEEKKPGTFIAAADMLNKIIQNVPEREAEAKAELIRLAQLDDKNESYDAVNSLIRKYGEETVPILVDVFTNSSYRPAKAISLDALIKYGYQDLENLMRSRLISDSTMTTAIAEELLEYYPSPYNYNFIVNNFNQIVSGRQLTVHFLLLGFKPKNPDSLLSTIELLENLNYLTDTVYNYTWLADSQFKDELQSIIQAAKSELQAGDSLACAIQVKVFQDKVDLVYKDSLNADPRFVTIEGWKFLYWNAQYILDRLPTPAVVTELELNEIAPEMSMKNNPGAFTMELTGSGFGSSSVVYFNGIVRATTFTADTLLTAAILASDVSVAGNFPVWVSDGSANSDTLTYKVVNNLPEEILPIMNCVTNNGNGTYTAYFGYNNKNSVSVFIPIYAQNKISPGPWDRGQPGVFKVGVQERVFSVTWTSGNIIWHLNNKIAIAKRTSPPCQ
jgi:hypothetical protein